MMFTFANKCEIVLHNENSMTEDEYVKFNIPKRRFIRRPMSKNKTKVVSYRLSSKIVEGMRVASDEYGWNLSSLATLVIEQYLIGLKEGSVPSKPENEADSLISFRFDLTLIKEIDVQCEVRGLKPVELVLLAIESFLKASQ